MRRVLLSAVAIAALTVSGCAGHTRLAAQPGGDSSAVSEPYMLYTHCGIDEANIAGRWYEASPPLSDGSNNPPSGWDNPYQRGVITFVSATEADFSDAAGHHVRFFVRPAASGPRHICS